MISICYNVAKKTKFECVIDSGLIRKSFVVGDGGGYVFVAIKQTAVNFDR